MLEDPCIEVSDSLSSRGGIKTLEFQSGTMELDVAEIATRVGPDYSTTNRHLEKLGGAGTLIQKRAGCIRMYGLCGHRST